MDIAYDYITKGHHLEENAGEMIERRTRRVLEGHHLIEHSIRQADPSLNHGTLRLHNDDDYDDIKCGGSESKRNLIKEKKLPNE